MKEITAGSDSSITAPTSGPHSVPAPPMITIAMIWIDWSRVKDSTLMKDRCSA